MRCVLTKLQGILQSFDEERKDIESAVEASLKAAQSLDVSVVHTFKYSAYILEIYQLLLFYNIVVCILFLYCIRFCVLLLGVGEWKCITHKP